MANAPRRGRYRYGDAVTLDGAPATVVDVDRRRDEITVRLDREGSS